MKIGPSVARPMDYAPASDAQGAAAANDPGQVAGSADRPDVAPAAQPAGVSEIIDDGYDPGQLSARDVSGLAGAPEHDLLTLGDDDEAAALPPEIDPAQQDSRVDDFTRRVMAGDQSAQAGAKGDSLFQMMMGMVDEESDISNPLKSLAE